MHLKKRRFLFFKRPAALALSILMALPPSSFGTAPDQAPAPESVVSVPEKLGRVEARHMLPGRPLVVLIQDAHAVPEAQAGIRALIEYFYKEYGIRDAALEGAVSRLDTLFLRSFPEPSLLSKVLAEYHEKGELTAGTAAAILGPEEIRYHGMENRELYLDGLRLYREALEKEPEIRARTEAERLKLEARKKEVYSPSLLEADRLLRGFSSDPSKFADVLQKLAALKRPESGSRLLTVLESLEKETAPETAERELRKLAREIRPALSNLDSIPETLRSQFETRHQEFQTSAITAGSFALFLEEFLEKVSLPEETLKLFSGEIKRLAAREKRMRGLDASEFFVEFRDYADAVKEGLFRSEEERRLDRESARLDLLEKFASLSLSKVDWGFLGRDESLMQGNWEEAFAPHFDFYQNAEARERAFHGRIMELISSGVRGLTASAGGFHAEGLTRLLEESGVSYMLVTPAIKKMPGENLYQAQMRGDLSWKSYYRDENGRVSVYDAFMRSVRGRLLDAAQKMNGRILNREELIKEWRVEIIRRLSAEGRTSEAARYTRFLDELDPEAAREERPEWMSRLDAFINGLESLHKDGRLTERDAAALLTPAAIPSEAAAAADPLFAFGISETGIQAGVLDAAASLQQENPVLSELRSGVSMEEILDEVMEQRLPYAKRLELMQAFVRSTPEYAADPEAYSVLLALTPETPVSGPRFDRFSEDRRINPFVFGGAMTLIRADHADKKADLIASMSEGKLLGREVLETLKLAVREETEKFLAGTVFETLSGFGEEPSGEEGATMLVLVSGDTVVKFPRAQRRPDGLQHVEIPEAERRQIFERARTAALRGGSVFPAYAAEAPGGFTLKYRDESGEEREVKAPFVVVQPKLLSVERVRTGRLAPLFREIRARQEEVKREAKRRIAELGFMGRWRQAGRAAEIDRERDLKLSELEEEYGELYAWSDSLNHAVTDTIGVLLRRGLDDKDLNVPNRNYGMFESDIRNENYEIYAFDADRIAAEEGDYPERWPFVPPAVRDAVRARMAALIEERLAEESGPRSELRSGASLDEILDEVMEQRLPYAERLELMQNFVRSTEAYSEDPEPYGPLLALTAENPVSGSRFDQLGRDTRSVNPLLFRRAMTLIRSDEAGRKADSIAGISGGKFSGAEILEAFKAAIREETEKFLEETVFETLSGFGEEPSGEEGATMLVLVSGDTVVKFPRAERRPGGLQDVEISEEERREIFERARTAALRGGSAFPAYAAESDEGFTLKYRDETGEERSLTVPFVIVQPKLISVEQVRRKLAPVFRRILEQEDEVERQARRRISELGFAGRWLQARKAAEIERDRGRRLAELKREYERLHAWSVSLNHALFSAMEVLMRRGLDDTDIEASEQNYGMLESDIRNENYEIYAFDADRIQIQDGEYPERWPFVPPAVRDAVRRRMAEFVSAEMSDQSAALRSELREDPERDVSAFLPALRPEDKLDEAARTKIERAAVLLSPSGFSHGLIGIWPLLESLRSGFPNPNFQLTGNSDLFRAVRFSYPVKVDRGLHAEIFAGKYTDRRGKTLIMTAGDIGVPKTYPPEIYLGMEVGSLWYHRRADQIGKWKFQKRPGGPSAWEYMIDAFRHVGFDGAENFFYLTKETRSPELEEEMARLREAYPFLNPAENGGKPVVFANLLWGLGYWRGTTREGIERRKEMWMRWLGDLMENFDGYVIINEGPSYWSGRKPHRDIREVVKDLKMDYPSASAKLVEIGHNDLFRILAVLQLVNETGGAVLTDHSGVLHLADFSRSRIVTPPLLPHYSRYLTPGAAVTSLPEDTPAIAPHLEAVLRPDRSELRPVSDETGLKSVPHVDLVSDETRRESDSGVGLRNPRPVSSETGLESDSGVDLQNPRRSELRPGTDVPRLKSVPRTDRSELRTSETGEQTPQDIQEEIRAAGFSDALEARGALRWAEGKYQDQTLARYMSYQERNGLRHLAYIWTNYPDSPLGHGYTALLHFLTTVGEGNLFTSTRLIGEGPRIERLLIRKGILEEKTDTGLAELPEHRVWLLKKDVSAEFEARINGLRERLDGLSPEARKWIELSGESVPLTERVSDETRRESDSEVDLRNPRPSSGELGLKSDARLDRSELRPDTNVSGLKSVPHVDRSELREKDFRYFEAGEYPGSAEDPLTVDAAEAWREFARQFEKAYGLAQKAREELELIAVLSFSEDHEKVSIRIRPRYLRGITGLFSHQKLRSGMPFLENEIDLIMTMRPQGEMRIFAASLSRNNDERLRENILVTAQILKQALAPPEMAALKGVPVLLHGLFDGKFLKADALETVRGELPMHPLTAVAALYKGYEEPAYRSADSGFAAQLVNAFAEGREPGRSELRLIVDQMNRRGPGLLEELRKEGERRAAEEALNFIPDAAFIKNRGALIASLSAAAGDGHSLGISLPERSAEGLPDFYDAFREIFQNKAAGDWQVIVSGHIPPEMTGVSGVLLRPGGLSSKVELEGQAALPVAVAGRDSGKPYFAAGFLPLRLSDLEDVRRDPRLMKQVYLTQLAAGMHLASLLKDRPELIKDKKALHGELLLRLNWTESESAVRLNADGSFSVSGTGVLGRLRSEMRAVRSLETAA